MLSTSEIILEYVCPAAGMICANWMFMAPLADVRKADRAGTLGNDLNPTPWAVMLGNTLGWVSYGLLRSNLFIFFANAPGFLLSIYFNVTAIKLLYKASVVDDNDDKNDGKALLQQVVAAHDAEEEQKGHSCFSTTTAALLEHEEPPISTSASGKSQAPTILDLATTEATKTVSPPPQQLVVEPKKAAAVAPIATHLLPPSVPGTATATATANHNKARLQSQERMLMFMIVLWLAIASLIISADKWNQDLKVMVLGLTVNCNLVFFYGAPLTTIRNVLTTQSSAQLHGATMIRNSANGVFWTAYGIAVLDLYVALPNGLGAALGVVQMILWVIFPRRQKDKEESKEAQFETMGSVDPTAVNSLEQPPEMAEP